MSVHKYADHVCLASFYPHYCNYSVELGGINDKIVSGNFECLCSDKIISDFLYSEMMYAIILISMC